MDAVCRAYGAGFHLLSRLDQSAAKYVYEFMFRRANLGQGLAASTIMLTTVLIVLIPWALMEFREGKRK